MAVRRQCGDADLCRCSRYRCRRWRGADSVAGKACRATAFGCAAYQRDAGVQCSAAAGQTLLGDHISCAIGLIVQSALHRSCSPVEVERLRRPLQALGLSRASAAAAATVCATANRGRPSWGMIYLIVGRRQALAAVSPRRLRPQKAAAPLPRHVASAGAPTGDLARCAVRVRGGTRGGGGARRGDASALLPVRLQRRVRLLLVPLPSALMPHLLSSL